MVLSHVHSPLRRALAPTAVALAALLLAGCAVGPDYVRPQMDVPAAYKETGPWKTATPQLIDASHPWWEAYGDTTLSALVVQANAANQNIRVAEAQYREAQAIAAAAHAGFFPTVGLDAGANRAQTNSTGATKRATTDTLGLAASWEPDLWGAVRRSVEAGNADAQASADDLAGARLSIQTTLAQDYLQIRVIDLQRDLYASTTAAYAKALELTQHQYAAGTVLRSDVALAESQLKTAEAQAVDLEAQRSQLEHAVAVLTGQAPASFSLAPLASSAETTAASLSSTAALRVQLPVTPAGLPSELLERRPDIAGAERRVQAANANIGVAKAAYYPQIVLSASGGFSAGNLASLFNTPSRVWSLGAALAQTVFDGGLRKAHTDQAVAAYDASVAQYKQTVLGGFQQVEDNLATLRVLDRESALQAQAVQASQLAERLALSQYRAGTATYLSVVTAQQLSLTNQRTAAQVLGRQLAASVSLIAATGGGWTATDATSGN
ncbi:NodT family efflux transporter outer membrane factor (OMF) lipoprotein [Variovorax boronicumulans]|uniref:efflux transporter outer membrane subunit n=1 Tax=Variovorax boronicumulans TaxID=436515 RepID=UPI00278A3CA4|nr:efflux transporter outer membrane subunit [Variovorax boronicumulans]MDQ0072627.1 NodT family efflux transporter outer membrane factor (OMF) lipoprotein [Variovorax boronicumulans]